MLGGTTGNWDMFVCAMLGSDRVSVLVFCQCLVNVSWHADVVCAAVVVPFDGRHRKESQTSQWRFYTIASMC